MLEECHSALARQHSIYRQKTISVSEPAWAPVTSSFKHQQGLEVHLSPFSFLSSRWRCRISNYLLCCQHFEKIVEICLCVGVITWIEL